LNQVNRPIVVSDEYVVKSKSKGVQGGFNANGAALNQMNRPTVSNGIEVNRNESRDEQPTTEYVVRKDKNSCNSGFKGP
jgi:hypothetical protein